jgi:hypothetical protein
MNELFRHKDLGMHEKHYLVVLNSSPEAKALWQLMENTIVLATEEAMDTDPAERAKRDAAVDKVHAMRQFYRDVRSMIQLEADQHIAGIRAAAAEKELQEQQNLERIIFEQETGIKSDVA